MNETAIFQKLNPIYTVLTKQAHGEGLDIYDLQEGRDNVTRYLPKSFDLWYGKVLESFDTLCFLYRVFFPNEIAAYLNKSNGEIKHFRELKNTLSNNLPEFDNLATDVLAQ